MNPMMLRIATALAVTVSAPAFAGHVVIYAPLTDAFAASSVHRGPNVFTALSHYRNGGTIAGDLPYGPSGSIFTGGGSTSETWAQTSINGGTNGGAFLQNDGYASANLATGILKASTASIGPDNFGTPLGSATALLQDTVFFTNTSGSAVTLSLSYTFDGLIANPNGGNPGGYTELNLSCAGYNCYNANNEAIMFASGPARVADGQWQYHFNMNSSCFGENIYCGQGAAPYFQWGLNAPANGDLVDGFITTSIVIPTGETSLGLRGILSLDCRSGSSCNFGNTTTFRFGALPTGLSYTSASGVFLTAGPTNGAVPEPATWAMMIAGFGAIGASMRRRRIPYVSFV